jgi:hemolysin activation/secretion protein
MPAFAPPPAIPPIVEIAPPRYGAIPLAVDSHGYRYIVTGNTLLPPELLETALIAAPTPKDALGAVQEAYHRRGYNLVAITGEVNGKTVHVTVFQGTITELKIPDGLGWFFPGLEGRNDLRSNELVKDQVLAGAYAARSGQQVNVNVSPAANPAGTALTITTPPIPDYQPVTGTLTFGNYGNRFTGGYQAGGNVVANLTHGLQLTTSYVQGLPWLEERSRGSFYAQPGAGISAVTPYGIYGFSAIGTHFREGNATAPLFPVGNILNYSWNGTQLLYADTATRLSTTEALNRTTFTETVLEDTFTLLQQRYNWVALGGNYSTTLTLGGQPGNLTAATTVNLGISQPSGTLFDGIPGVPTPHFRYTTVSAGYQQHLPRGFELNLSAQSQWAFNTLPVEQQWTLGGFGNLSAWTPAVTVGDSGYLARLELTAPTPMRFHSEARFGMFVETGGATSTTTPQGAPYWQTLSDIGVSLRLTLPYQMNVTAMAALPIANSGFAGPSQTNLHINRVYAFFVIEKRF